MTKKKPTQQRGFYILLAMVVVAGGVFLGTKLTGGGSPVVRETDVQPAAAEGYFLGNPNAAVQVAEFADFECPACGQFSTVTEPDVRARLIKTGQIGYRYYDFPLTQHKNTLIASVAAACANDQGHFWEMHDALFLNQPEWSTEATDNPMKFFTQYAQAMGLDVPKWRQCVMEEKHLPTILGNRKEGEKVGVGQTPTFVIGKKVIPGAISYDEFRARVDSAAAAAPRTPAPAAAAPARKP
ncbi:MAG TPA: thioredoxin domain-containing protein [Gemmatimonadaceae bacterium]|nr:thioredoxin domain-containing protein [Gemmatimonadaceae bacterium]